VALVVDEQTKATQFIMYVAGCPSMDAEAETAEWATEYCWWPADTHEDAYVVLPDLAAMAAAASRSGDWAAVTDHAAAVVRALKPENNLPTVSGVAVGFDDGNAVVTWSR
jgi:hypothetical protein